MEEITTTIYTEKLVRISVDEYDEGVWLSLQAHGASMHTVLTRKEAEKIMIGLQEILAKEVA
jgi:ABC-type methionine transport system permease subunit